LPCKVQLWLGEHLLEEHIAPTALAQGYADVIRLRIAGLADRRLRCKPLGVNEPPTRPIDRTIPRLMDRLRPDARVRSTEYGTGTIESVAGNRIIIWWDRPMPPHRLDHHRSFAETLELLD
jgi:hypothetical protein